MEEMMRGEAGGVPKLISIHMNKGRDLNFCFFFCFFRATLVAYGCSQARGKLELQLPAYTTATATGSK